MTRYLQSNWMVALLGTLLYLGTTLLSWRLPNGFAPTPARPASVAITPAPSWEFSNPELDQLIIELREEKLAVAKRQRDLDELALRIDIERTELTNVIRSVEQLQRDFDRNITRIQTEESANLKKLAKLYSSMEPADASLVLEELDDAGIVKILSFMKEDQAAPILETLARKGDAQVRRVAGLSERLRLVLSPDPISKAGL